MVLEDILARARNMQLMVAQVAPMFHADQACDLAGLELLAARGDTRRAATGFGAPHRLPIADYTLHGWGSGIRRTAGC